MAARETITLPTLISRLAADTATDPTIVRRFVHEYFMLIQSAISTGETVRIKGLGTFSLSGNPEQPVNFTPDKAFAEAVNEPFAMFEPVSLPEEVDTQIDNLTEDSSEEEVIEETVEEPAAEPVEEPVVEEPVVEAVIEETPVQEPIQESVNESVETPVEPSVEESSEGKPSGLLGVVIAVVAVTGIILGLLIGDILRKTGVVATHRVETTIYLHDTVYMQPDLRQETGDRRQETGDRRQDTGDRTQETAEKAEPAKTEPVKTEKSEKYDTIEQNRFLTTMARENFGGKMEFWAFIYEANPGLGNPSRIRPGTRVRIPDESEFRQPGETDAALYARAKRLAADIQSRY